LKKGKKRFAKKRHGQKVGGGLKCGRKREKGKPAGTRDTQLNHRGHLKNEEKFEAV